MNLDARVNSFMRFLNIKTGFLYPELSAPINPGQMRRNHGLDPYLTKLEMDFFGANRYKYRITYNVLDSSDEESPAATIGISAQLPPVHRHEAILADEKEFTEFARNFSKLVSQQYQLAVIEGESTESNRRVINLKRKLRLAELAYLFGALPDEFMNQQIPRGYFKDVRKSAYRMANSVGITFTKF